MTFGERFKELRIERNLKQQELVDDFNNIYGYTFTKSSISQYENNKRRPETNALRDFSLYFDVSVDYLLDLSDNKNMDKPNKDIDLKSEALETINKFFDDDKISREDKDKLFKKLSKMYFESLE